MWTSQLNWDAEIITEQDPIPVVVLFLCTTVSSTDQGTDVIIFAVAKEKDSGMLQEVLLNQLRICS